MALWNVCYNAIVYFSGDAYYASVIGVFADGTTYIRNSYTDATRKVSSSEIAKTVSGPAVYVAGEACYS